MGNTLGWCLNTVNAQTQTPVSIMTFCPGYFGTWSQSQLSQSWRQLQSTTFPAGQITLDHFKGYYLGQTMSHEFSHAKAVVGNLDLGKRISVCNAALLLMNVQSMLNPRRTTGTASRDLQSAIRMQPSPMPIASRTTSLVSACAS